MNAYPRMISYVKPHWRSLFLAYFSMVMNSLLGTLPLVGLIIPFVDTILAGKPMVIPHADKIPPFVLDIIYRVNAMPRLSLLNMLIIWTVSFALIRQVFEFFQTYFMTNLSQQVIQIGRAHV